MARRAASLPPPPLSLAESQYRCGFVALVGRPNVGKSTLLNALVGAKVAIVTPKPQTTRNRLLGIKTLPQAQLLFVDTPGIHQHASSLLNQRMVAAALQALQDTDVALFLVDAQRGVSPADEEIAQRLSGVRAPVVVVVNKIDLVARAALLPLLERLATFLPGREIVPVSALTGENTAELLNTVIASLPPGPALYPSDELTDQSERVLAQEVVREQLFLHTQQEVPYATAVVVEEFNEKPEKSLLLIRAVIYVERPSQKAIIIGERGARLKQIGQAARLQLEAFFGCKVFLELFVKVTKGWTNSLEMLKELGL
ncbi:MAG: GTPase Era [Deltaproteobacteria bacterium]|nr:GTPase Era [Deltaproteobacteria bacterium]